MAAILAEIKSRMLLPRPRSDEEQEEDPRAELVRRLQEYERFKQAAEDLDALPRQERDFRPAAAYVEDRSTIRLPPEVALEDLLGALRDVMSRAEMFSHHQIQAEPLSVRERMSQIVDQIREHPYLEFQRLFTAEEGRMGVVVSFLALMELSRESLIDIVQHEPLGQIYVRAPGAHD
jgi:segregation and condensation protein A